MGRGLSSESKDLMARIMDVFRREHPNSPRRVAYALFGNRAGAMAGKVSQLCGRLLEVGQLPLEWYDDSSRAYVDPYVVEDIGDLLAHKRSVPPFDPWRSQPNRVVVWSEKSVGGTLAPVLDELSIPFLNTSGWNSRKMLMTEARRTGTDARRLIILYVGDHDASGLRMSTEDLPTRLAIYHAVNFEIRRIAITRADFARQAGLGLTDPMKVSDPNAAWYIAETDLRVGVELESLSAPELRERVRMAVLACIIEPAAWLRTATASRVVRESWEDYVAKWPAIVGLDPEYGEGQR